jgi:ribonucleoside-diphosphate reductase beta chain
MRLYHKAKKLGVWDPRSIDLTQDALDWQKLPENKKDRLKRLIIGFQAGEESVTLDLLPLIMTIAKEGRLEEEMFLTTFLWEEAKHTEFFRRFLDEAMQEHGDLHSYRGVNPNGRDLFGEVLPQTMNALLTDPSPVAQVKASILYNMIIEGVLAETGYHSFAQMLDETNMLPGLRQGLAYIKRDESRHIAYGVFLISRLVAEDKSLWPVVESRMHELFDRLEANARENSDNNFDYARMQFQKRLASIERARRQTLEQVYKTSAAEDTEEVQAD